MRIGRILRSTPIVTLTALLSACSAPVPHRGEEIGLVVLISVDQLPAYLFSRYDTLYQHGLRRLLQQGGIYTDATHDHALTWTSAGHATLVTGVVPARHGIVANGWLEVVDGEGRHVESVDDDGEQIVGVRGKVGMSPRNLLVSSLPDWIVATDPESRVVSISGKRTAAVLMGGKTEAGYVYYFEDDVGRFVTSTYYRAGYPDWAQRFNDEVLADFYSDSVWECQVPSAARKLAREDDADYENGGKNFNFPHAFSAEVTDDGDPETFYDWWDHTPALDQATLELARAAVAALSLGRRGHLDYLAVSLSQLDRVGHYYGPLSLEQLDAILALDQALGGFLDYLDAEVGAGRYILAFTSDHGVVELPGYRRAQGSSGREVTASEQRRAYREALEAAGTASDEGREAAIGALERLDFVADVMTIDELTDPTSPDSFIALYQRSYSPGRVAGALAREGLVLRLAEGMHGGPEPTTHGSPYLYDRNVPLIFFGSGIERGTVGAPARSVDVAPTLAELAGIPYPADLDGRALIRQ
ncbi:MAG: alkaline phosphatase family protein [Gemmatimonadota bacterium]|nr:MAG: alkaline phosphatase family protein [Gemmatimonadota bacterium]